MDCKDLPELIDDNVSEEDEDMDDDDGDEALCEPTRCLFCPRTLTSVDVALKHVQMEHKVDFASLKHKHQMDQYSFIKLINYLRANNITAEELINAPAAFWNDDVYLKPKEYEPWLTFDYENLDETTTNGNTTNGERLGDPRLVVKQMEQQLQHYVELLAQAESDMKKMRSSFQRLMNEGSASEGAKAKSGKSVAESSLRADEGYFDSYAHFGIHHEMLSDAVRTASYRKAILENADFFKGKTVLDVGCGTSVLSIFASQAGAAKVIGIDNSDIIYNAMEIVRKNRIDNVKLVKGRLEDTALTEDKFDIIISEWMGYFLLFEGMLDTIIYARDKLLKPGGALLPNRCTLSLVGYGDDKLYSQHVKFWDDVYGLDMSNMRKLVMHEPLVEIVDEQHVLTDYNVIANFDLMTVDLDYSNFAYDFKMKCTKAGTLTALVGFFDAYFDLPIKSIHFGTGPRDKPTHWKQVVFFFDEPQNINVDDVVTGHLECKRSCKSARSLDITIEIFNKKHYYYLD